MSAAEGWVLMLTNGQEYSDHTCWVLGVFGDRNTAEKRADQINALLHLHKDYGSKFWDWDWEFRENVWWASFKHLLQSSVQARQERYNDVITAYDLDNKAVAFVAGPVEAVL